LFLALLLVSVATAWAQQEPAPATDTTHQVAQQVTPASPTPDKNGVYRIADGITAPVLVNAVPAQYPASATETDQPIIRIVAAVVGVDGVPTKVQLVSPRPSSFDASAIAAVQQSKFQPGTLDGKPVPVLIHVRVPFFHLTPAIPKVMLRYAQFKNLQALQDDPTRLRPGDTPPKQLHFVEANFSNEARKKKIQGTVLLSALINTDGMPVDLRVERSLGYGLDEKALQALSQYRFQPGLRDGNPVPIRLEVEMNFRLY
jgi:TonB family protein